MTGDNMQNPAPGEIDETLAAVLGAFFDLTPPQPKRTLPQLLDAAAAWVSVLGDAAAFMAESGGCIRDEAGHVVTPQLCAGLARQLSEQAGRFQTDFDRDGNPVTEEAAERVAWEGRRVARTDVDGATVQTDHQPYRSTGALYETMVSRCDHSNEEYHRWADEEAAMRGHLAIVDKLRGGEQ